jgi:hypothetical protein
MQTWVLIIWTVAGTATPLAIAPYDTEAECDRASVEINARTIPLRALCIKGPIDHISPRR